MRTQPVFSLALVAFATTILTAPIKFSEDAKATIVAVGQDFGQLTAREVGGLVALAAGAESSHQGADASSLLGELPASHTESRRANDAASLRRCSQQAMEREKIQWLRCWQHFLLATIREQMMQQLC
ncbi:uncharacterized protein K444DRAFT_633133 [Hyaloscypha bicolor E]|uniref:Uncharacterized protein n=1 Tax=Hyaloscypha bicolor E TaxID=1095630 RepID=A0A2J6SZ42_9HELO|nr:uncharacterized protein K444DRAFT_633133 [Hyaloscypha bicolor E]PMD56041.1 hypothetical protein K444DRAFT_633133 [Hyaloscypha bicolor E]